ncbi:ATP-binding protein [Actinotalea ferrariae]|nr:ATP-binding protein [Actinotalea ferrariae]
MRQTWVLDSVHELSTLRAGLSRAVSLDDADPPDELDPIATTMVLVASELATNALRHGIPPTVVRLFADHTYLLDVADHDPGTAPHLAGARPPGEGGLGLQIARRLAVDVAWYATDTTKHVWARFGRADLRP